MTPVEFARAVLADESVVILDTETTGLDGAFVVEIAVMGVDGRRWRFCGRWSRASEGFMAPTLLASAEEPE